jgi:cell division septation protein DedD
VRQSSATVSVDEKPSPGARREQGQRTDTAKKDSAEQVWTVQIKSSPDKKYADNWVNRLKTKGYDAFVAEGDVKGQTWYRVRVGHFAARHEAEELLAALETQEGLSGGFLTMTSATDTVRKPTSQVSKKE